MSEPADAPTPAHPPAVHRGGVPRPVRVLIYLLLGGIGVAITLLSRGPMTPQEDAAALLSMAQAVDPDDVAGKYQTANSAAHVYNMGAGYVITLRVEGHPDFPGDCFFMFERLFGKPAQGQLVLDAGAGKALEPAQVDAYLETLEIDTASWDALCDRARERAGAHPLDPRAGDSAPPGE